MCLQVKTTFPIKPSAVRKDVSIDLSVFLLLVNSTSSERFGSARIERFNIYHYAT